MVNTRFWIDEYTSGLDPIEKLLFLYFLTNPATDICGIYEIPLKTVASDTGIEQETVKLILKRFRRDGKIFYKDGWVGIKNFIKHQSINPKVQKGIEIGLNKAPNDIKDSLSLSMDSLSHSNSNLNSNSNTNTVEQSSTDNLIPEVIKLFEVVNPACKKFYGNKTQRGACANLLAEYGFDEVSRVIAFLPQSNKIAFMPTITTPVQLWDKYQALKSGLEKKKSELSGKGRGLA